MRKNWRELRCRGKLSRETLDRIDEEVDREISKIEKVLAVSTTRGYSRGRSWEEMEMEPKVVLEEKGAESNLPSIKQLLASLTWTDAIDFDLAALYEAKDGRKGMVYYGDKGDLNAFPFMQLSGDEGVGDTGGSNEETMRIVNLDEIKKVHLVAWDYNKIRSGAAARFGSSNAAIYVLDDKGESHQCKLASDAEANVALIATIDNSSPIGAKLINQSRVAKLEGLEDAAAKLWAVAEGA